MAVKKTSVKNCGLKKTTKSSSLQDISQDLNEIFDLIGKNFENAWHSEEKKKIEKELNKGIKVISKKLSEVIDITKSKAKTGEQIALSKLHQTLQKTSVSLKKASKSWKIKK